MSNQATVVLRPVLKINNRKCNCEGLKKVKATITTISYVDKVPLSKTYEDLICKNDKDIELLFNVPPNLESVYIEFEATIFNIAQQKPNTLVSSHYIDLKTNSAQICFYESHLRKVGDEYTFIVLGKNGEPISNIDVIFRMTHTVYATPTKQISLTTDDDGTISLGKLEGMKDIESQINSRAQTHKNFWALYNLRQQFTIPETIEILEDEVVELPFLRAQRSSPFSGDTFSLVKLTSTEVCVTNEFEKATFVQGKENQSPNLVVISGLKQGFYRISFKEVGINVKLTVHAGTYWKDRSFILTQKSLREFKGNTKVAYVRVKKVEENKKDKRDEYMLKVCNFGPTVRVHVMTTNFIAYKDLSSYHSIKTLLENSITTEKFKISSWKNAYLSNRKLSDEYRYVFERKYLRKYQGNSLVRPQLLLKRMKVRETTYEEEIADPGEQYDQFMTQQLKQPLYGAMPNQLANHMMQSTDTLQLGVRRPYRYRGKKPGKGILQNASSSGDYSDYPEDPDIDQYKSYLNFLKNPGIIKANLVPDKKGNLSFTVPGGKFTNLIVIVSDEENIVQARIDIPSCPADLQKRDLSLTEPLDPKKHFNEVRQVIKVDAEQKYKIKDITSASYTIIDNLEKVK